MATNQNNGQDAGPNTGQSVTDATPDYVFDGTSAAIVVPVGDALLNAEYSRSGPDLYLETPDGQLILVTNYFAQDIPPDLFTLAGSRITADVAAKLAGPRAPGQVAQNGDLSTLEEPIGTVDTIKGVITVIRADGTQVTLTEGDTLYQGDTLVSGADSAIGIIFADKSTMSMASNARIILDELIYDPQDMAANSQVFNVIQGAFMFTSGAIGKSDPEDVSVNTPVATIGIRGTKFGVSVDALDGATNVTIFEGAVFVQNGAGNVLLTGIGETTLIPSYTLPPSDPRMLGLDEIQRIYGDAIGFHPVRQEIPDDHAELDDDDLQDIADDLIDIETAAGGEQQPGEGASDEFGEIGAAGIGQSGLGGTPLGSGGDGSGEEGIPGAGSGGDGTGDDVEDIVTPGVDGPSTVEINPGVGVFDPETGVTHFTPSTPLTSGTDFSVSAPSGPGVQQLHLNAEQLGGPGGNAGLTLQSGSAPDDVEAGNNSVSLSSTDGMDLSIHGFEELALTLGGGDDSIDIQDLGGTSIISDTVTIDAGDGNDVVLTSDGTTSTSLVIDGGAGNDFLNGGELDDEISGGSGNDTIQGGAGNDSISGGTGDDIIIGATGDDFLEGNEDNDIIVGSGGDDTLLGGSGDDTLEGGSGSDVVDGGTGDDRAIFIVGQAQTEGVNDAYDGGADTDTIVINYDAQALENPTFRQAILDIHAMLGNAASGSPEEFDTAPFQALGLDIQGFEAVELDGPAFAIPIEATPAGEEDGAILLNLAVVDVLSSKTVSVTMGNLNGATPSAGTDNGDGTFTLTAAQLEGLTITPAADSSEDLELSITVTTVDEFGNTESIGETLDVSIAAVADAPNVNAESVSGQEDTAIALNITAIVADEDGSEVISFPTNLPPVQSGGGVFVAAFDIQSIDSPITITGFEPGTVFSAGNLVDDVLHLTAEDLPGLTLTPPANFSGDMDLTISVTATDTDPDTGETSTATTEQQFTVAVAGVADAPTLTIGDADGLEDNAIDLDIAAALTDESETLSGVTISGLNGATLSAGTVNEDGSVTLTAGQLENLTITPPLNFSGDLTLSVSVTSTDGESTSTTTKDLTVSIAGVADAPTLTISDADGLEDNAIGLDIAAALTDESETLSDVTISGLNGATLSAGTVNEDGSVTLTAGQLENLTITPPLNFSGDLTLSVSVTSTDGESTSTTTKDLTVSIAGVADAPTLTISDADGLEDNAIGLDIAAALTDESETLSGVTISGLNGAVLSAGTVNEDGSVTLTAGQLENLTITPPLNFSGDLTLSVSVTSTDGESTSTTTKDLTVSVAGVADAPTLTISDADGLEDNAIGLDIAAALTDESETLSGVTISGLNGATLSAGTVNEDGSVTLTAGQLENLTITPPLNFSGDLTLSVSVTSTDGESTSTTTKDLIVSIAGVADAPTLTISDADGLEDNAIGLDIAAALTDESETLSDVTISGLNGAVLSAGTVNEDGSVTLTAGQLENLTITPPLNFSGDLTLSVSVTSTDGESTSTTTKDLTVSIAGVADAPTLTVENASGLSGTAIALNIASALQDQDGSESLSVTIAGLPSGASLVDGDGNAVGSDQGNGVFGLSANQLNSLFVLTPEGLVDDFTLTVTATATESDGDSENTIKQLTVDITGGTAGEAVLTITDATGLEDNAIPLSIAVGEIEADDTATITLSGIPSGAVLKNGDGVVISVEDGEATLSPDDLDGLTITPPTDSDADFNLTVTVVTEDNASGEQASVSDTIAVTVGAVADAPDLDADDVDGSEDTAIELDLAAALSDEDGSESLTDVVISGLPAGATLSAGVVQTDGSVKLTAAELEGLTLTPPQNFSGDIALTISATSEDGTEDSAEATKSFTVSVAGVADTPTLELGDTTGNLAAQIPVDITSSLTDLDGSEELTVTVSGLNGAILSAGTLNEDGTVTLTAEDLDGLTITPVPNTLGAINLTVTATATEENGDTSSVTGTLKISVEDSSNVVLVAGQDLNLVAPVGETPGDTQKLVIDASFGGATTGDDWIIAQDELGRVTITNTVSGQLVTAAGYEEIDIDFGPGEDTVELRDLSNTDLSNNTLTLNMGDGDDTVVASEVVNRDLEIFGGDGNDNLQGSNGADLIDGGADDDVLVGGGGIDDLDGGEGSDNYLWSEGDGIDAYGDSGTEGTDTIVAQAATFDGFGDGFNAGQSGIEAIGRDSDGDGDVDPASPLLIALSDSSETVDFSGLDFLNSQTTIDLGGGDDTVISALADGDAVTYSGGEGQDTLNLLMSASSLNQMIASGQLGLLQSYIASPDNAVLTMTAPNIVAQGFEVVRIGILNENGTITDVTDSLANAIADNEGFGEFLVGSNDPDLVFAGGGNDIVRTFAGDDIVFAGEGEDFVNSGSGDDFVDGGSGNDIIDGGQGNDRLLGGDGADLVSGGQGDDVISGGDGNDFLAGFSGNDFIEGDAGDDFISGGSGDDTLLGGDGNDRLVGGSGNDLLVGGDGIDILEGEAGDDVLISDGFEDQLLGGSGNDVLISTMDDLPTSPVPSGAQGQFSGIRDGGTGEDTFRLDSSDVGPHSLSGDELSHIRNIETLDLSGVDELQLSLRVEDVVTMTDEDNDLTILLGENVTSVQIDDETIQLENGQAVFQQDGVQVILQQQQPAPEAS